MNEKKKILVVDDNDDNRVLLKMFFVSEGHEVELARCGTEALAKLQTFQPEFAFIDIGLPDMDGCEIARRYLKDTPLKPARLIAVTGFGGPDDIRACHDAGFSVHFLKPLDLEKLKKTLL